MTRNGRPLAVTLLSWVYIGVGAVGFVYHFTGIHADNMFRYDGIWIEAVEVLAIVCGAFMLCFLRRLPGSFFVQAPCGTFAVSGRNRHEPSPPRQPYQITGHSLYRTLRA